MHVLSKRPFNDMARKHPNDAIALMEAYRALSKGIFKNPEELRAVFPSIDRFKYKDKWWVIDIGGNNLRIIAAIEFIHSRMYVKFIGSHSDYDKFTDKHRK
jgi:mRNA interferase HigB